jgi:hypothetical protein
VSEHAEGAVREPKKSGPKPLAARRIVECMIQHPLANYHLIGVILAQEEGRRMPYQANTIARIYRKWAAEVRKDMPTWLINL